MSIRDEMKLIAIAAKQAGRLLAALSSAVKDAMLTAMAATLEENVLPLIAANALDLAAGRDKGLSAAMLDRLALDEERIFAMAAGLREVAALPDPVGEVTGMWRRPNGLQVGRMRIPLGVIGIVYESRPNVTADAAALCLKSGNAVILRGGSEAIHSNRAIGALLQGVLTEMKLPPAALQVVTTTDREAILELLQLDEEIDLIIPRGGENLIRFVAEHSRIPVIKHYKGVCHVFVDASADFVMAEKIALNAKVQRPGVCNSMETLLIHKDIAESFIPRIAAALGAAGVEIRGCPIVCSLAATAKEATDEDWAAEYLDLILAVKVVANLDAALDHISTYSSLHTEAIVTSDYANSQRFIREVNSSTVIINASTRFADGNQLGLGAEIGISTTKLHSFGPMGLEDLTTRKFIVFGDGQIRS